MIPINLKRHFTNSYYSCNRRNTMKPPKITDAEWQVMKIIWENKYCTANDIVKEISRITDWKPNTTRTLINRLLKKMC